MAEPERKVRNVTPEEIPVIVLPPKNEDRNSSPQQSEVNATETLKLSVLEDGTLVASGTALKLHGVTPVPREALCEGTGGRWACGLRAYIALREFAQSRAMRCDLTNAQGARCFAGEVDLSAWLLSGGWAEYDDSAQDEAVKDAAAKARERGRGIWANQSRVIRN